MKRHGKIGVGILILLLLLAPVLSAQEEEMPADTLVPENAVEAVPVVDPEPVVMPKTTYKPGKKLIIDGVVVGSTPLEDGATVRIELQCPADNTTYVLMASGNNRGLAQMSGSSVQVEARFLQEEDGKPVLELSSFQVSLPPDNSPDPPPPPPEPEEGEGVPDGEGTPPPDGGDTPPPDEGGQETESEG